MARPDGLTHLDAHGAAHMVDVSAKASSPRSAEASAVLRCRPETVTLLRDQALAKGDAATVARIAGIMAAKKCGELIPLCHPIGLDHAAIAVELLPDGVRVIASVGTAGRTGVEMEALCAASVAAMALYDMVKGVDRGAWIERLQVDAKRGGASGDWQRSIS